MKKHVSAVICKIRKILFATVWLSVSMVQLANASEQLINREVKQVLTYESIVVLLFSPNGGNKDGCTRSPESNRYIGIDMTREGADNLFATALSAKLSGTKVSFGVSGCVKWGGGTIPKIYRVHLM